MKQKAKGIGLAIVGAGASLHRDEVDAHLRDRRSRAEALRHEIEAHSAQTGLRGRLLADALVRDFTD